MTTGTDAPRGGFFSLDAGGLDWDCLPLRLYRKGNARFWNPADVDLERDAEDWAALSPPMREAFTGLCAMFVAGEEAVTRDLQPFIAAMSAEGRFADEMYLTQFCYEEARHVEVFRRWLDAVGLTADLNARVMANPGYRAIFCDALPSALQVLTHDPSPVNQVRASVTYNHVVEGTLALTGYHAWNRTCTQLGIFPGMRRLISLIGDDERRHMAWGTYTCRRHVAADPALWAVVRKRMSELLPHAVRQIHFATQGYSEEMFGMQSESLLHYATSRARRRLGAIRSAVHDSVTGVEHDTVPETLEDAFAAEDAAQAVPGIAPGAA